MFSRSLNIGAERTIQHMKEIVDGLEPFRVVCILMCLHQLVQKCIKDTLYIHVLQYCSYKNVIAPAYSAAAAAATVAMLDGVLTFSILQVTQLFAKDEVYTGQGFLPLEGLHQLDMWYQYLWNVCIYTNKTGIVYVCRYVHVFLSHHHSFGSTHHFGPT